MDHSCGKEEQREVDMRGYIDSPESNVESLEYGDGMLELSEASRAGESGRLI